MRFARSETESNYLTQLLCKQSGLKGSESVEFRLRWGDEQAGSIRAQNKLGLVMRGTMHLLSGATAKKNKRANLPRLLSIVLVSRFQHRSTFFPSVFFFFNSLTQQLLLISTS